MPLTHDGRTTILIVLSQLFVFTYTLISVPKASYSKRVAACVLLVALDLAFNAVSERVYGIKPLKVILPTAMWTETFHAIDILLVCRATIEELVESEKPSAMKKIDSQKAAGGSKWSVGNILAALGLLCNWRRIGTRWQISKIPPFSRDNSVPSRGRLIFKRLLFVFGSIAILDACAALRPDPSEFKLEEVPLFSRLGQVSASETVFRAAHTASFFLSAIVGVYLIYAIITVVVLATGLSTPASCPTMFGSLSDACSLRGFWGDFYHQGLRRAITGPADAFVDNILCIPRGNLVSRYLRLTLAFMSSGFMHHFGDNALGVPVSHAGQFVFFTSQAFGIMFEDAAEALYNSAGRPLPFSLERVFGYLWVFAWLMWTGPGWFYPIFQYMGPPEPPPVLKSLMFQG